MTHTFCLSRAVIVAMSTLRVWVWEIANCISYVTDNIYLADKLPLSAHEGDAVLNGEVQFSLCGLLQREVKVKSRERDRKGRFNILSSFLTLRWVCLTFHWILGWGPSSWWQFFSWSSPSCQAVRWRKRKGRHHPWSRLPELCTVIFTTYRIMVLAALDQKCDISKSESMNHDCIMERPAGVNSDEKPALLCGVAQGQLHLACDGWIIDSEDTVEKMWSSFWWCISKDNDSGNWHLCVTHMEKPDLCLRSRWDGTHLGMTSSSLASLAASPGALRHTASWVSKICRIWKSLLMHGITTTWFIRHT